MHVICMHTPHCCDRGVLGASLWAPQKDIHLLLQVTSDSGHPNLLTAKTGDHLWRLVRKGVAPAFNPQNIRSASRVAQVSAGPKAFSCSSILKGV